MEKLSFNGFSALQSGQKRTTVAADPMLIASATYGKFTITAPVTKKLNLTVGDYVLFLDNRPEIEDAIGKKLPALIEYATNNGIDLNTVEGIDSVISKFRKFAIAKGVLKYDGKGNPVMVSARMPKEEKEKYLFEHIDEIVSDNRKELLELIGRPDATDDELKGIVTIDMIEGEKVQACIGSKTMSMNNVTGIGCQLNFSDSNIWNLLKNDLGDEKSENNRVFDVDLEHGVPTQVSNGKEMVEVIAYPISFKEDKPATHRTRSNN